jgi:23S rRNA (uridine2552-2'-O)-methyltransferase
VSKVFQGGTEETLLSEMKKLFGEVKHAKPPSSRKESAELYVIAKNYQPK